MGAEETVCVDVGAGREPGEVVGVDLQRERSAKRSLWRVMDVGLG
jgi:hypothetical protein